ncbi:MAG: acyloxyacyl hydrolase [Phycisphaerales bacterium]
MHRGFATVVVGTLAAFQFSFAACGGEGSVDALALMQEQAAQQPGAQAPAAQTPATQAPAAQGGAQGSPQTGAASTALESAPQPLAIKQAFGEQNSLRFNVEGDWLSDWDNANMAQGRVGVAWFFLKNVELDLFLTLDGVSQPGPDAFGGGFDMQIRWHMLAFENWSIFGEIGGGILGTTHSVPAGGSQFNFTPNIGVGATFALTDSTRLYTGVRWFHISNAGLYEHNPGRDSFSLWVGLSFSM